MRRHLITIPADVNPGGLLTIKAASRLSGIPESTIRGYRRQPGIGLKFCRVRGRLFLKCDEFIAWINIVAEEVSMKRFMFTLDSVGRGKDAPGTSSLILKGVSL